MMYSLGKSRDGAVLYMQIWKWGRSPDMNILYKEVAYIFSEQRPYQYKFLCNIAILECNRF